jgi:Pentapeptide repeats (8 copies)
MLTQLFRFWFRPSSAGQRFEADPEHLKILRRGVDTWNAWRAKHPSVRPNLRQVNLREANLIGADLTVADLVAANLSGADLSGANLRNAGLADALLERANLTAANLRNADLDGARLRMANLTGADLREAILIGADLLGAKLIQTNLSRAHLDGANLTHANLREANLSMANLVEANLTDAHLSGCRIYGVSAWDLKINKLTEWQKGTNQQNLIITRKDEPEVAVDNIEVAQFVYLLLHNEKIREVIDTIGKKGVLLLGRFTEGRIVVLERLRDGLRERGYLPIVFNFDKPETKDFTETVRLLTGLSKFVVADITNPKSAPLELQAAVPEIMVPFRPIIEEGEKPFAMLQDLWIKHREWMFEPIYYSSVDALIASLDEKIIRPAEQRFAELLARKAETMKGEHV